ncbi:hypothetical protein F7O86_30830, partial [Pseudomonas aeruginosa]
LGIVRQVEVRAVAQAHDGGVQGCLQARLVGVVVAADQAVGAEDAPVSYPFLWNVPQLDRVQWTGFNPNHINVVDIDNRKFD